MRAPSVKAAYEGRLASVRSTLCTSLPRRYFRVTVSPGLQFGTALGSVGGSAGEPSSCCSVKVKGIRRYPSGQVLAEIDRLYGISPRDLDLDPDDLPSASRIGIGWST